MSVQNVEIKAYSEDHEKIRDLLRAKNVSEKGIDHQVDTYFNVPNGRLKLREGNIENHLIHYMRNNQRGPKGSVITLYDSHPESSLKEVLINALGILIVVDKEREIFFIDNVKFHIDTVKDLGAFMEIEAIDSNGSIGKEKLLSQCNEYMEYLNIKEEDLLSDSYSDMLLEQKE